MIQNSATLVDLGISIWTGRKLDKKVSEEIDQSKNTRARAGNYNKILLAGTKRLEELQKTVTVIRQWHYEQTLPWSDNGARLLTMANFFNYKTRLNHYMAQFDNEVKDFLTDYPTLVTAAAFQLGDLFDPDEYPSAEELRGKFRFRYLFTPLPDAGDFRVDIGEAAQRELREQYEAGHNAMMAGAMKDIWERLHTCLSRMSDKLAGEEKQIFRDSLVGNATELCELLTRLNVTNDAKLEEARKKLESALVGVDANALRKDDDLRLDVKAKVDEILSMF
jgi:hypothetical protein